MVAEKHGDASVPFLVARTLLHAADTRIPESDKKVMEEFAQNIANNGARYGITYNWEKLEALKVRHDAHISLADGTQIKDRTSMVYLGSLLTANGRSTPDGWTQARSFTPLKVGAHDYLDET